MLYQSNNKTQVTSSRTHIFRILSAFRSSEPYRRAEKWTIEKQGTNSLKHLRALYIMPSADYTSAANPANNLPIKPSRFKGTQVLFYPVRSDIFGPSILLTLENDTFLETPFIGRISLETRFAQQFNEPSLKNELSHFGFAVVLPRCQRLGHSRNKSAPFRSLFSGVQMFPHFFVGFGAICNRKVPICVLDAHEK